MWEYVEPMTPDELYHSGVKGQKWGVRRYQNEDGTLTPAGRERYGKYAKKYETYSVKSVKYHNKSLKLANRLIRTDGSEERRNKFQRKEDKFAYKANKMEQKAINDFFEKYQSDVQKAQTKAHQEDPNRRPESTGKNWDKTYKYMEKEIDKYKNDKPSIFDSARSVKDMNYIFDEVYATAALKDLNYDNIEDAKEWIHRRYQ